MAVHCYDDSTINIVVAIIIINSRTWPRFTNSNYTAAHQVARVVAVAKAMAAESLTASQQAEMAREADTTTTAFWDDLHSLNLVKTTNHNNNDGDEVWPQSNT